MIHHQRPPLLIDNARITEPLPKPPDARLILRDWLPVAVRGRPLGAVDGDGIGEGFNVVARRISLADGVKLLPVALQQRDAVECRLVPDHIVVRPGAV